MKLLTKENLKALPELYAQDGLGDEAIAYVKFFTPDGSWTWYATEFDPTEGRFFGLVDGFEEELGYFMLAELEGGRGPNGLAIERDRYFKPTALKNLGKRKLAIDAALKADADSASLEELEAAEAIFDREEI